MDNEKKDDFQSVFSTVRHPATLFKRDPAPFFHYYHKKMLLF